MTATEKIKSRGHWVVRIRPEQYASNPSHSLRHLERAVQESAVALRGWDYPHYSSQSPPVRSVDYVEQTLDWQHYVELWRAYRSGQFVSMNGLWEDWREQSDFWPPPQGWRVAQALMIEDVVFRFTEIYEFASRWLHAMNVSGLAVIACTLRGLQDRQLIVGPGRVPFIEPRMCRVPEWASEHTYAMADLFSQARELAVSPAISLFELFGWDVNPKTIRDIQSHLRS